MALPTWLKINATWRARWVVTALVCGVAFWAARISLVQELEWKTENARIKVRATNEKPPHGALRLLMVDDASVGVIGQWPFPRAFHGNLMHFLSATERVRPAVLSWDVLFVDAGFDPAWDAAMTEPLAGLKYPVVMGAVTTPEPGLFAGGNPVVVADALARVSAQPGLAALPDHAGALLPIPGLLATTQVGFLDSDADSDGIVRRLPLVKRVGDQVFPSLVLQTLLAYWKVGPEAVQIMPGEAITVRHAEGTARVPIDDLGFYRLNYRYEVREGDRAVGVPGLSYFSLYQKLAEAAAGDALEEQNIRDAIIMVGQTATGLTDIGPSPLAGKSTKTLVHLNAIDNILRGDYRRDVALWPILGAMLALGLVVAWVLDGRGYKTYAVAVVVTAAALAIIGTTLWMHLSIVVPLAVPLGALFLQQGVFTTLKIREEQAKRERVRGMFANYLAPALVNRMVNSGEEPQLGGVEEEITAYFSDIEGFSGFSEALTPTQLVDLMNEYLTACTDIVQAEGGTLDKYIGDALVAMYGAPLALPEHGHRAVVAALRVQRRCAELRTKWRNEQAERNWPEVVLHMQTRIGLNLGRAVVGNMGSRSRFNYTMMGDTVNLAARLESGAKAYGVYTLVAESVVEASRRAEPDAVRFRLIDRIVVKGRSRPVAIYEAMALQVDVSATLRQCAEDFGAGLERYWAQDWSAAREAFRRSLAHEVHEKHNPSKVMLARVDLMELNPPGEHWDGIWRMTSK